MANELKIGNKVVFLNGLPVTLPTTTSDPGGAVAGDIYYNSTTNVVKYYDGSTWQTLSSSAGFANTALSNLTSPTAINQHLLPDGDATRDLGSSSFKWRDLYISDGSIKMGTTPATAGAIRIPFDKQIAFRDTGNTFNNTIGITNLDPGFDAFIVETAGAGSGAGALVVGGFPGVANSFGVVISTNFFGGSQVDIDEVHIGSISQDIEGTYWSVGSDAPGGSPTAAVFGHVEALPDGPRQYFFKARGTTVAPAIVASGDEIGSIYALGYDGVDYEFAAAIRFESNGTPGSDDMPGAIRFLTTPDGSTTLTSALVIQASQTAAFAGRITNSRNGALGSATINAFGTWITGGTSTSTKPHVLIEPTGTTSTNWNTSGTGLGINAASGFAGNLIDAQVNGVNSFRLDSTFTLRHSGRYINDYPPAASQSAISLQGTPFTGGSSTTTKSMLRIANASTDNNWNTNGTIIGTNVATGFTGDLIHQQVEAVTKFKVDALGNETLAGSLFLGVSPNFAEFVPLATFTLADAQTGSPQTIFSVVSANYTVLFVEYSIVRNGIAQVGLLTISNDGTNVGLSDSGSSTGTPIGITFSAVNSGANLLLQYNSTATGFSGAMKYHSRRW